MSLLNSLFLLTLSFLGLLIIFIPGYIFQIKFLKKIREKKGI